MQRLAMAKIFQFPGAPKNPLANGSKSSEGPTSEPDRPKSARATRFIRGLIKVIWVLTVLVWPLLRWIVAFEVLWQFLRMLWHWNTPGVYAGWTFLLHFALLTALTYFVGEYEPEDA
jgi:hypothetical protein